MADKPGVLDFLFGGGALKKAAVGPPAPAAPAPIPAGQSSGIDVAAEAAKRVGKPTTPAAAAPAPVKLAPIRPTKRKPPIGVPEGVGAQMMEQQ